MLWLPLLLITTCLHPAVRGEENSVTIEKEVWGNTSDGQPIHRYLLTNAAGHNVALTNWGATLLEVNVPDRDGQLANVNLCMDSLAGYQQRHPHYGGTIGRFANRIAYGRFAIDGTAYQLETNNGPHHLHGGSPSYDHRLWKAETFESKEAAGVRFALVDPDGFNQYPGTVNVTTEYEWNNANELKISFTATSDAKTHVNLTNHSYWNLAGAGSGSAMDHICILEADHVLEVDETLIPTGKFVDVAGTPFDFKMPHPLAERLDQLPATGGYDHCFVVRGKPGKLRPAARVIDPQSGRALELDTTQPGMQLYTANHLPGNEQSNGYGGHEAFCLETQHFPDSPNRPEFPSTLLEPGKTLTEVTIHRFSVAP